LITYSLSAQESKLRFSHITVDDGLSQNTIHGIIKDKYGFMWFGTWEGINIYDGYNFKIFRANEIDSTSLSNNRINYLFKDSLQNIWVVTGDYIISRYNYETENFSRTDYKNIPAYILEGVSPGSSYLRKNARNKAMSWNIINSQLVQTDLSNKNQLNYTHDPFDIASLNDYNLTLIYLDNHGILWVGTENGGINKADIMAKPFENFIHSSVSSNSIIDNVIRAICEDGNGNIWVGTLNKGVTKINIQNNQYKHYTKNDKLKNSLVDNNIRHLYCDKYGFIWMGTKNGLSMFNPKTNEFTNFSPSTKNSIPHKWVFWIMEDHSGYLWIGTFNGIAKYNRKTGTFLAYKPNSLLKSKNVRVIYEDKKYNFWVATEGGGISLLKRDSSDGFNEKLTPVKHFTYSDKDSNTIINNMVLAMTEDENGMIWIGTNNGLCMLNPSNYKIKRFNIRTGLPDNLIMGLICDFKGNIWISHKKGLSRLNVYNFSIRTYNKQDGLPGNEFTQNAYFKSKRTDKIYFGGTSGMCAFSPDSIKDNPYPPQIVFTSLKVLNQPVYINQKINNHCILEKSLLITKEITLRYGDKTLSIEFAGLHYSNPLGNKYKYKLEGFDNKWIETDGYNRIASYSNLAPQKYTFKVMASNCDGIWNPDAAELIITVLPPWWRSWWAYTLYIASFFSLLYFSYRLVVFRTVMKNQVAFERVKAEKEAEISQIKINFFTHISHEFRTPLSLIIDPLLKLKNGEVEPNKAKGYYPLMFRNAQRLMELINQILDFRKTESGHNKLELYRGDIIDYIKNLVETFRMEAIQRHIEYQFETSVSSLIMNFDPDKLNKIITNILSNAFKYTNNSGKIKIKILKPLQNESNTDIYNCIQIDITDTGIGIKEDAIDKVFDSFYHAEGSHPYKGESSGIGLALAKGLTELHKGKISVKSIYGKGSCFSILLPTHLESENIKPLETGNSPNFRDSSEFEIKITEPEIELENNPESPILLIVEDNLDIRAYLTDEFSGSYTVLQTKNGEEGYNTAINQIPDLIISDVMMPVMDGFELCKKLKTDERTSHIPLILLTARQSDQYKIEGYNIGADAYMTKPFNTAILKSQVNNLIKSRQTLRTLFGKGNILDLKTISVNLTDENFLNKAIDIIKENLSETEFNPDILAASLKMSLRQLYRKIKALTDTTVHDFIISVKLNLACELLLSGDYTISEVAYKTGFTEPANFTRSFTKKYGKNPSTYIQEFKNVQ
jgi:signal transduction histidine kinase/ligand-binding sensor domain-containing protein/DNA-binding response OmpR family regulator